MSTPNEASARPDGRQLRSSRTREAVAQAMLDLIEGGSLQPTAREVAAQAGVSERAVFRHFDDLESLLHAVSDLQAAKIASLAPPPAPPDAAPAERIERFVERWCAVHEMITPVRRAAQLRRPFSAEIRKRHAGMRSLRTRELEAALGVRGGADRHAAADRARDAQMLVAIAAIGGVVSWAYWEQLRAHQRLSKSRAATVVRLAVDSLLREGLPLLRPHRA